MSNNSHDNDNDASLHHSPAGSPAGAAPGQLNGTVSTNSDDQNAASVDRGSSPRIAQSARRGARRRALAGARGLIPDDLK